MRFAIVVLAFVALTGSMAAIKCDPDRVCIDRPEPSDFRAVRE